MPVMWKCPGQPTCRKIYLYTRGLKAHIPSCKHALRKEVQKKREVMETMLSIIHFVEDQQKGNVTVSRLGVPSFRVERPVFSRLPPEAKRTRLSREQMGGYPILEEIQSGGTANS
ncbi:uncharacterized protein LOC124281762 [Haliotis rubra]|uniref:uncharacterized protein LOC124281762 n=1 Tax=Haliotis rubra TaxID=36100 RepID=UPI001EE56146|nr:uncharacterized protein LOC124281762 [Haliotis rubra]